MPRRLAALALLLLPALAQAQLNLNPADQNNNRRRPLRNLNRRDQKNTRGGPPRTLNAPGVKPKSKFKPDEALRNFTAEDRATRLEGVQQLGQTDDEAKAVGYLLQAANDSDMAIRLKGIDV